MTPQTMQTLAIAGVAIIVAAAVLLKKKPTVQAATGAADPKNPASWEVGPIIGGVSLAIGMPVNPVATADGLQFALVHPDDEAHYVTMPTPPLTGKQKLALSYRLDLDPGAKLDSVTVPGAPTMLTLYFQRAGDDWSGLGALEAYRWYAAFAMQTPITPGEHTIEAPLDGAWTAVQTSSRANNPQAFADAIANTARVGFVLGGGTGLGHGIRAVGGAARFTITNFSVE